MYDLEKSCREHKIFRDKNLLFSFTTQKRSAVIEYENKLITFRSYNIYSVCESNLSNEQSS